MTKLKERWRAFRQWQRQPYVVAPLSNEPHTCPTCGTQYEGNYCPRCGQSARIGRYSFKSMALLFLDVWGLGNRGMFRSLRDLVLRPGYMIRDYLKGMQMAYFPPFKMFFLLTTFSLIVSSGLNLKGENTLKEKRAHQIEVTTTGEANDDPLAESKATEGTTANSSTQKPNPEGIAEQRLKKLAYNIVNTIVDYQHRFPSIFSLFWLVLLSGFLYIFFRKSPAIPDLRYSEFLVALVYTSNMYSIYTTTLDFLCIDYGLSTLALALTMVPLKQLSGFRWWRVICYSILSLIIMFVTMIVLIIAGFLIIALLYK